VCAAARVVHVRKNWTKSRVLGVTSVDRQLYVLLDRNENQVAVYRFGKPLSARYRLRRHLNLPGVEPNTINDVTSCVQRRCLYTCMSDCRNRCIHRCDLASSATSKWSVSGKPRGVSVTSSGNLLVTCEGAPNKLVELSADSGQCVREITLRADHWHNVQLTTGHLFSIKFSQSY